MEKNKRIFIIAEAGVNHNGNIRIAKKMVDVAKEAGTDAVKFQTFIAEKVTTGSQFKMLKRLELSKPDHRKLKLHCDQKKIVFMSTPFDLESLDFLNSLGLNIFKIPSGEITNFPYLRKIGKLKKEIIMSTGMADLEEIKNALNILISSGTSKKNITALHCNTAYPTPPEDVNLRAMLTIRDVFKIRVGYSDHTLWSEVPIAAVALGATVIEKHFTLDRNMKGPDHKASLEPNELKAMVRAIRNVEKALGSTVKKPTPSEHKNRIMARRSIVAAKSIKKGELFTEENVVSKRPAIGISPMEWNKVIGRTAEKDFKEDELIKL